jgi:hypothetical protein
LLQRNKKAKVNNGLSDFYKAEGQSRGKEREPKQRKAKQRAKQRGAKQRGTEGING